MEYGFPVFIVGVGAVFQVSGENLPVGLVAPGQAAVVGIYFQLDAGCGYLCPAIELLQLEIWLAEGADVVAPATFERDIAIRADDGPGAIQARLAIWKMLHTDDVFFQNGDLKYFPFLPFECERMRRRLEVNQFWTGDTHGELNCFSQTGRA